MLVLFGIYIGVAGLIGSSCLDGWGYKDPRTGDVRELRLWEALVGGLLWPLALAVLGVEWIVKRSRR